MRITAPSPVVAGGRGWLVDRAAMRQLPEHILHAIEAGQVPTPPQLLLRLFQLVDDEHASIADLSALIGQDPGLTARLLNVANSAALRRNGELHSLEHCVTALGTRLVRTMATCLSIQRLFERGGGISAAELARFWGHSLLIAELSRRIALAAGLRRPDEAYLAGLLHDVGQLILLSALGEPYARFLAETGGDGGAVGQESGRFGVHHGEAGAWLVERWQLAPPFAEAILLHHAASAGIAAAEPLPRAVWLARALSEQAEPATDSAALFALVTGGAGSLAALRQEALDHALSMARALGIDLAEADFARPVWDAPPAAEPPAEPPAEEGASDRLSAVIGGMALLQPLQQDLFALDSEAEILLSLKESARILFDLNRIAFLFPNERQSALSGAAIGNQAAIFRQVEAPLYAGASLAATAALGRRIRSSFDGDGAPESPLDQQFARALGSAGLLCIPMLSRRQLAGVMICGLSAAQHQRLAHRLPWLMNFGHIAAIALASLREAKAFRRQAELAAAGHFSRQARRIVHETVNPLGIIKSYLKILDRKLPEDIGVRQELEVLREEIDRVASIVGRMSELPGETGGVRRLDLAGLIDEMLLLYGDTLFEMRGIRVESAKPDGAVTVGCDRDSLKQILLNLWKNASEALSRGQRLRIAIGDGVAREGRRYVPLHLDDDGPGMPEASRRALDRPADTVGATPRGIGLALVGTLAARQGILVDCRTEPGQGAHITLLLPRGDEEAGAEGGQEASGAAGG